MSLQFPRFQSNSYFKTTKGYYVQDMYYNLLLKNRTMIIYVFVDVKQELNEFAQF